MTLDIHGRPIDMADVTVPIKRIMERCEDSYVARLAVFGVAYELADEFQLQGNKRESFLKDCGAVPRIKKEDK